MNIEPRPSLCICFYRELAPQVGREPTTLRFAADEERLSSDVFRGETSVEIDPDGHKPFLKTR